MEASLSFSAFPLGGPTKGALCDPAKLARLVIGELPGSREEPRHPHWGAMIIFEREILSEKLRRVRRFMVHHGIARARHPNDDEAVLNFDQKTPAEHFWSPEERRTSQWGPGFPASALAGALFCWASMLKSNEYTGERTAW
jgi:hypothetical protein